MSIIKKSEFKSMNETQLNERLAELRKELMKVNTQIAMGTTPENPGRVRAIKKTIARILGYSKQIRTKKENEEIFNNIQKRERKGKEETKKQ